MARPTKYNFLKTEGDLNDAQKISAAMSLISSIRKQHRGRDKIWKRCPYCLNDILGVREWRVHMPQCKKEKRDDGLQSH